jgi:hypothetical protein
LAERPADGPLVQSEKARGKRRATEEPEDIEPFDSFSDSGGNGKKFPDPRLLPPDLREAVDQAKKVLTFSSTRRGKGTPKDPPDSSFGPDVDSLVEQMRKLPLTIDTLRTYINTAQRAANEAERSLDYKYKLLGAICRARSSIYPPQSYLSQLAGSSSSDQAAAKLLSTFLPGQIISPTPAPAEPSQADLFRALSRIDSQRPPAQISDEVRRAERDVQRAAEMEGPEGSNNNARRVTGVFTETPVRNAGNALKRPTTPNHKRATTPKRNG